MGDLSDEIPGVGGIGKIGALDLMNTYGCVDNFFKDYEEGVIDKRRLTKKIRDFAESAEKRAIFERNMMLMDLHSALAPKPQNLKLTHSVVYPEAFYDLCEELMFKSIVTSYTWIEPFIGDGE
jgi:5'-3' exonuclease